MSFHHVHTGEHHDRLQSATPLRRRRAQKLDWFMRLAQENPRAWIICSIIGAYVGATR
jgi:hypothetical protein